MSTSSPPEPTPPPLNDPGLAGAERRILVFTLVCVAIGGAVALLRWSVRDAAGVLAGGVLSLVNLYWIRSAADALVCRSLQQIEQGLTPRRSGGTVRALIHFGLLAVVFYAIFISHLLPIGAVLTGFFAAVGGIILEACWETLEAMRGGSPSHSS